MLWELSVVTPGNSDELSREELIAIGYPLGQGGNAIVSKDIFSVSREIDKMNIN